MARPEAVDPTARASATALQSLVAQEAGLIQPCQGSPTAVTRARPHHQRSENVSSPGLLPACPDPQQAGYRGPSSCQPPRQPSSGARSGRRRLGYLRPPAYLQGWLVGRRACDLRPVVPSTRTCHVCGTIKRHLKVEERTFRCRRCDNSCDQDRNAAANLAAWAERSGARTVKRPAGSTMSLEGTVLAIALPMVGLVPMKGKPTLRPWPRRRDIREGWRRSPPRCPTCFTRSRSRRSG